MKECEIDEDAKNSFWLPKPYPNVLGKSILAFEEPYAAIFPGVENFPEETFDDKVIKGTILHRGSTCVVHLK